jgi:hypothetical protein
LSDINVSLVSYNEAENALVIIYENSNIDIIYENEIINLNDILMANNIQGDKTIFNIYQHKNRAYLSTGFGIVVIDLTDALIITTTETPKLVNDFTIFENHFYAAMGGELFQLGLEDEFNFQYWSLWDSVGLQFDLPSDINHIETFDESLYVSSETELYVRENNSTKSLFELGENKFVTYLQSGYNYLMAGILFTAGDDVVRFYEPDHTFKESKACHGILNHSIETEDGRIFYGDQFGGYRYSNTAGGDCQFLFFEGPPTDNSSDIIYKDGILAVAGGGPTDDFDYGYSTDGFYFLKNGKWTSVRPGNTAELKNPIIYDFFRIEIDPDSDVIYAGTYWGGLVRYHNGNIERFEDSTSCLEGTVGDRQRERIAGLFLDEQKDLWVSNYLAPQGLKVFRSDGSCEGWNIPVSSTLADLIMDDVGLLWVRVQGADAGLLVFDQGDPGTRADDRFKAISSSNSALPNNEVTALSKSRNGNIWVGTSDGLILFACGEAVFEFNCSSQPIVDPDGDGVGDFLLDDVEINTVITDGANRVWVGTDGGIIVLSPSGSEQLMQFDKDNSPLLSNVIIDFTYDEETGIMYISTAEGLMAYRTQSTAAENFNSSNVYAYPNPVYPQYDGPIAIKGVAEDAIVKITDLEGRVIHETEALGGQAIWDGTQWNGEKASSGVYLAWITGRSDFTKPSDAVVKIVIIR